MAGADAVDLPIDREVSVEDTIGRVTPILARIGVTRVADITGLDRVGIPVMQAIAPRSADLISVYSGKGVTPPAARASALMESVERYCATIPAPVRRHASITALDADISGFMDPRDLNVAVDRDFDANVSIDWTGARDLVSGVDVLVPISIAGVLKQGAGSPCVQWITTNGLASGNTVDEAILHALCEVIERDDLTFAEVLGHRMPFAVDGETPHDVGVRVPFLRQETLPCVAAELVDGFTSAGLAVDLRSITGEFGLPSVLATVKDPSGGMSRRHLGIGTSPDPTLAVTRALTEVAQSRAGDISALREDMLPSDVSAPPWLRHAQRLDVGDYPLWDDPDRHGWIGFGDLPSLRADNVRGLIDLIVGRLSARGLDRVLVADLSRSDVPFAVVRVIVPGLESWAADRAKIGARVTARWNELATMAGIAGAGAH